MLSVLTCIYGVPHPPWYEEEDEDRLAVAPAAGEGVAHEGGEVRDVLVGLPHLARTQLHVDRLGSEEDHVINM